MSYIWTYTMLLFAPEMQHNNHFIELVYYDIFQKVFPLKKIRFERKRILLLRSLIILWYVKLKSISYNEMVEAKISTK